MSAANWAIQYLPDNYVAPGYWVEGYAAGPYDWNESQIGTGADWSSGILGSKNYISWGGHDNRLCWEYDGILIWGGPIGGSWSIVGF